MTKPLPKKFYFLPLAIMNIQAWLHFDLYDWPEKIKNTDNTILQLFRQNQQRVVNGIFDSYLTLQRHFYSQILPWDIFQHFGLLPDCVKVLRLLITSISWRETKQKYPSFWKLRTVSLTFKFSPTYKEYH